MGGAGPLPALEKPPAGRGAGRRRRTEDEEADPAWSPGSVGGDQQREQSAGAQGRRAALSYWGKGEGSCGEEAGGSRARGHVGRSQKKGSGPTALVLCPRGPRV